MKLHRPRPRSQKISKRSAKLQLMQSREMVEGILEYEGYHAKQVLSLANAVAGSLSAARAGIRAIGEAYAELADMSSKNGVKQVDRMLSNTKLDAGGLQAAWARYVIGKQNDIAVALDWTEFERDSHSTLVIGLVTKKGRALPLLWQSVDKKKIKGKQTATEVELIERLHGALAPETRVTLLADRGFAKPEIYETLEVLGFDYVIRFRSDVLVTDEEGRTGKAGTLVPRNGRTHKIANARITGKKRVVPLVVMLKRAKMKQEWCLLSSLGAERAADVVKLYGRRFTIEETFRDTKNLNLGIGLSATRIRTPGRRDRLLLVLAMAQALLTLLGEASERSGYDRYLKVNTVKTRTVSLVSQGYKWWRALPNMSDERLLPLLKAYEEVLRGDGFFARALALDSMNPAAE